MKLSTKRQISRVVSPIAIQALKLHTKLTGAERARIMVWNEFGELLLVLGYVGETWTFPGGGINRRELPIDGAIRELYEETGLRVVKETVAHVITIDSADSHAGYTAHIYQTTIQKNQLSTTSFNRHEIIETRWVTLDKLPTPVSPLVTAGLSHLSK